MAPAGLAESTTQADNRNENLMALTIRRTGAADYGRFVKMLVVGPAGSGKTRFGATAPSPMYADCEGGLMTIAEKKVPYAEIETTLDLQQLRTGLDQDTEARKEMLGTAPETIVVDTIDEVQRLFVRERLKESGKDGMTMQDFGWLKDRMLDVIRNYRNLPLNVVFLCHAKEVTDEETGVIYTKPGLQGAVADEIAAYMDIVGLLQVEEYMDVEDDEAVRKIRHVLHLQPSPRHSWLKDRSAKLPARIPLNGENDFKRIVATVFANVPEESTEEKTMDPAPEKGGEDVEVIEREAEQPADPRPEHQKPEEEATNTEDTETNQ